MTEHSPNQCPVQVLLHLFHTIQLRSHLCRCIHIIHQHRMVHWIQLHGQAIHHTLLLVRRVVIDWGLISSRILGSILSWLHSSNLRNQLYAEKEKNEIMRTALEDIQRMDNNGKLSQLASKTIKLVDKLWTNPILSILLVLRTELHTSL